MLPFDTGSYRQIAFVRAFVVNACSVAGAVLHFAQLDA